ncbi:MAG: hypothetical protein Q4G46_00850 [Propionibacteriaceae bacterium]|nr:hypothetical protein [Propionibacteriaceae bacterium]
MNIEQTVSAAIAGLQLGDAFDLDDLVHAIETRRGRPLRMYERADLATSDGICALWFALEDRDVILLARTDSALHRQQFVLHELAHLILGHCEGDDCVAVDTLLPGIPPNTIARLLRRQDLDCDTEIAAEALADRLAAGIRGRTFADSPYLEVFG